VTDIAPPLLPARVGPVTIHTDKWGCAGAVDRPHPFEHQPKTVISLDSTGALAFAPTATLLRRVACPAEAGPLCPRCNSTLGAYHWKATDAMGTQVCLSCGPGLLRQGLAELTDEGRDRLTAYVEEYGGLDTSVYDPHHGGRQVGLAREWLRVDAEHWGESLRDPLRRALQSVVRGPAHQRQAVAELLAEILADAPKGRRT